MELNYDGFFTILLALCGGLYHWLRNNLPYYEATIMNAFVWGVIVGWVAHALWVFMIRPIIREAIKNE